VFTNSSHILSIFLQHFLGIIDAFVANKHSIPDHGKRLLKVCKPDFLIVAQLVNTNLLTIHENEAPESGRDLSRNYQKAVLPITDTRSLY
jgi:hypothetical protein